MYHKPAELSSCFLLGRGTLGRIARCPFGGGRVVTGTGLTFGSIVNIALGEYHLAGCEQHRPVDERQSRIFQVSGDHS